MKNIFKNKKAKIVAVVAILVIAILFATLMTMLQIRKDNFTF